MSNWREKPSCQGIKIILNIFKLKKKKKLLIDAKDNL